MYICIKFMHYESEQVFNIVLAPHDAIVFLVFGSFE